MDGTYKCRYAALSLPANLYDGVNQIVETSDLPGEPPEDIPDDRNWLKAPPPYRRRGIIFDITELYLLSQAGGWPVPIYDKNESNWP